MVSSISPRHWSVPHRAFSVCHWLGPALGECCACRTDTPKQVQERLLSRFGRRAGVARKFPLGRGEHCSWRRGDGDPSAPTLAPHEPDHHADTPDVDGSRLTVGVPLDRPARPHVIRTVRGRSHALLGSRETTHRLRARPRTSSVNPAPRNRGHTSLGSPRFGTCAIPLSGNYPEHAPTVRPSARIFSECSRPPRYRCETLKKQANELDVCGSAR